MRRDERREVRFRGLYGEHLDAVARYAARRVDQTEVHDVVSETFLVAWRRLEDVPADALPWLFATARGVISNRRRSSLRRRALGTKLALQVATPPDAPDRDAVDEALLAAIAALPDAEREAFVLVAWDGLDPARAALAAGCADGTFRMRLHRARARLRQELEADNPTKTLEDTR